MIGLKYKVFGLIIVMSAVITVTAYAVAGTESGNNSEANQIESLESQLPASPASSIKLDIKQDKVSPIFAQREKEWTKSLAQKYAKSEDDIKKIKSEIGELGKVEEELLKEVKESEMLTDDEVIEMIKKGIGITEIETAEELASRSDKSTDDVLKMRFGPELDGKRGSDGIDAAASATEPFTIKDWKDIEKELGLEKKSPVEQLEVPADILEEMKKKGLSDDEMLDIALLGRSFGKSYQEVWSEFKQGKTYDELLNKYKNEKQKESSSSDVKEYLKQIMDNAQAKAKKKYNATDKEITKCEEAGFNGFDIMIAKKMSVVSNVSVEELIRLKNQHSDWFKVADELGVSIDEM